MLLSSYFVYGLAYVLPATLGARLEYYQLDIVPVGIMFTACLVLTATVMGWFEQRDRRRVIGQPAESAAATVEISPEEEDAAEEEASSLAKDVLEEVNTIVLVGCLIG